MANLREIAIGLATTLQITTEPKPLGVDLWGHSADQATFLVAAVIDEAMDAGMALTRVSIDKNLLTTLAGATLGDVYRSVRIQPTDQLVVKI